MKKVLGIGVVVVLIGVGVFFFLKNKESKEIVPVPEVATEEVITTEQLKEATAIKNETQPAPVIVAATEPKTEEVKK